MNRLTKRNPDGSVGINEFRYYNHDDFQKLASKLADYEDMGTIEELNDELYSLRAAIDFYQAVGSVTECRKAVEKQTPMKPEYEADGYSDGELVYDYAKCPICGHDFEYGINDWECEYCSDCGQKLDWE